MWQVLMMGVQMRLQSAHMDTVSVLLTSQAELSVGLALMEVEDDDGTGANADRVEATGSCPNS